MMRATCLVAALVAMPIAAEAQQPCTSDAQAVVSEAYSRVLERSMDEGASGWVTSLQNGSSVREIVARVTKSSEYAQNRPTGRLFSDEEDNRFDSLDLNGNGRVERSEWRASADAFARLDRDDNGVLSRAEVMSPEAFNALDGDGDDRLSVREWPWSRATFSQQDTNGDGLLTRQEFLRTPGFGR